MDATAKTNACQTCSGEDLSPFFSLRDVPVVCNQLCDTAEEAKNAERGDLDLKLCKTCGTIANTAFDPRRMGYDAAYENALHYSPRFQEFAENLAERLIEEHKLAGKVVAEIGCGDGYFLRLLHDKGIGSGIGFDPSMANGRAGALPKHNAISIIPEYFEDDKLPHRLDALVCRHVLEHIPNPTAFLKGIRETLGSRNCIVYFEVPNAEWMLKSNSMWDVIYEHVTYWTPQALDNLFRRCGFAPQSIRAGFRDQYLMIEARPSNQNSIAPLESDEIEHLRTTTKAFQASTQSVLGDWHTRLNDLADGKKSAVLWGSGSKGVTFVNAVPAARAAITSMIDVNIRKQGKFVPGTAHPITTPQSLPTLNPDLVLVANEIYMEEIKKMITSLGLSPDYAIVAG